MNRTKRVVMNSVLAAAGFVGAGQTAAQESVKLPFDGKIHVLEGRLAMNFKTKGGVHIELRQTGYGCKVGIMPSRPLAIETLSQDEDSEIAQNVRRLVRMCDMINQMSIDKKPHKDEEFEQNPGVSKTKLKK